MKKASLFRKREALYFLYFSFSARIYNPVMRVAFGLANITLLFHKASFGEARL